MALTPEAKVQYIDDGELLAEGGDIITTEDDNGLQINDLDTSRVTPTTSSTQTLTPITK